MNIQNGLASAKLNDRIDSLVSSLKNVAEHLLSAATTLKERAAEAESHAVSRVGSLAKKAGKAARNHPFLAAGVVLGVGYLIMRSTRR